MKPFLKIAQAFALLALLATSRIAVAQKVTLTLPGLGVIHAAEFVADERGFWKSRGLDVKMSMIAGPGAVNALMSGSAQITVGSPGSFYVARARGQNLQAIASTYSRMTSEVVLRGDVVKRLNVAPTADLATRVRALKGLSLGVDSINGVGHGVLRYMAREVGVHPEKDLTVSPMQSPGMPAALRSRRVDGIVSALPWTALAVKQAGGVLWIRPAEELPKIHPFAANLIVVRGGWCEQNHTTCEKIVAGIKDALAFIHDQPQLAYAIVRKRAGAQVDPEVMLHSWNTMQPMFPRTPLIDQTAMRNVENFSVAAGLLKESERVVDWGAVINNRYAR